MAENYKAMATASVLRHHIDSLESNVDQLTAFELLHRSFFDADMRAMLRFTCRVCGQPATCKPPDEPAICPGCCYESETGHEFNAYDKNERCYRCEHCCEPAPADWYEDKEGE